MDENVVIGAVDVGAPKNIGWAIIDGDDEAHGNDLDTFIEMFSKKAANRPSALGFECPLFIPLRSELPNLTRRRDGEGTKPWSAGAGATVTTIGLAIAGYTLAQLRTRMGVTGVTMDWNTWPSGNDILLWEAFVYSYA